MVVHKKIIERAILEIDAAIFYRDLVQDGRTKTHNGIRLKGLSWLSADPQGLGLVCAQNGFYCFDNFMEIRK